MSHLRHQLQVELFEQAEEFIPKQLVCLAEAALLVEGGVLEVAHLHADAARDVVADGLQPTHLLFTVKERDLRSPASPANS